MVIKASSAAAIRELIQALGAADPVRREGAVARLAVIGPRAAEHLLREFPQEVSARTRAAMLQTLEALADPRAVPLARAALADPSAATVFAAVALLRAFLTTDERDSARDAFEALVAATLDRTRAADQRVAAFQALQDLPAGTLDAVRGTLSDDPDPAVRAAATGAAPQPPDRIWTDAVAGRLPPTAEDLRQALAAHATTAALTALQHVIDAIRTHEADLGDETARSEWRAVRGAAHQALAGRGSRLALYDLRDSLAGTERLPVSFLAALAGLGDATCLEPLAAAYAAPSSSQDPWWREHVASAFRAIVAREGLTRRHAALRRVASRWPGAIADLTAGTESPAAPRRPPRSTAPRVR
ncbi:MAG TPA: hypothetical protein VFY79_12250 [Dehalococcoidia bacterium]|nr:hypothetical protein [Dehalococcoidia bacterium]